MPGPTLAEIRRRKGIPRTLRMPTSNSGSAEVNPFEAAKEIRESIRGDALVQSAIDEVDISNETRRLELETRRTELEVKKRESEQRLADLRAPAGDNGHSPMAEMAFSVVEMMKEQNAAIIAGNDALKEEIRQSRESQLHETITNLAAEVTELRRQQTEVSAGTRPADSTDTVLARIEELSSIREAIRPFLGINADLAGVNTDLQQIIALKRLDTESQMRLEQLKDEREKRDWDRKMDLRKLNLEETRVGGQIKMFENLAPLLGMFVRQRVGLPVEAAAGLPSTGPISIQNQSCQREGCQGVVSIATGQNIAACPDCGTVYQLGQEE